jgi:hypothetical protein
MPNYFPKFLISSIACEKYKERNVTTEEMPNEAVAIVTTTITTATVTTTSSMFCFGCRLHTFACGT